MSFDNVEMTAKGMTDQELLAAITVCTRVFDPIAQTHVDIYKKSFAVDGVSEGEQTVC